MTTPVATNGSWSAAFVVPSYLGGPAKSATGAPTTPGRYEFTAQSCKGDVLAKALFRVTAAPPGSTGKHYVGIVATADGNGYWLVQADGTVHAFGDAGSYGSLPAAKTAGAPIVGMARTYDSRGYWLVGADGHVYSFGDARAYGSWVPATAVALQTPVTGIAAAPDGKGYWLLRANGTVQGFGDAKAVGAPTGHLAPYDAIAMRPAGGYVITAGNDGAVYVFPGGQLVSGGPGAALAAALVGTAVTPSGNGTWQTGTDGGVITWGDATYYGSLPGENVTPKAPVIAIAGDPDGHGYWLLGAGGHVYNFGDAELFAPAAH
jgi:hypothetical protein